MSRDALVVGINTYQSDRLANLPAPSEDAEAIAQLLERYGDFKVTRLPAVKDNQNKTPCVGKTTKVTLEKLEKAIVQLFKPESQQYPDTALLYFSGHGLRKNRGIEEGFLATSDVNPDLGNWGLSLRWLRQLLQASRVRQQIIWLDCCYSGEILTIAEADPGERGIGRDRCFIAASRAFEEAFVNIGSNHSVLTEDLLKGLLPNQEECINNYTLVDFLTQNRQAFPQRPIFANSGEAIVLTRGNITSDKKSTPTTQPPICPYKGLAYFDCKEEDAKYFYGRKALTDQLVEKVRLGKFLAVLGASGSGKSSVVRAGLLYQLQQGHKFSGSDRGQIYIMQPGEHPLQSLALAFVDPNLSLIERAKQLGNAEDLIKQGATGLRCLVQASSSRVVLVIDQFEEAFTLCQDQDERQQFFACILGALEQIGTPNVETLNVKSLQIIITMRADFFGKCLEQDYSGLAQQIQANLVTVTPMNPDELRQAIVEPAKRVNLEIEPELVEEMLADVANAPGSLPLLQYTLMELWKQRTNNCLRLQTYAKLGKVMGTLSQRANDVYDSFSEAQQTAVRHIFLSLTQLGEGTEDTRRRVLKPDLVNERYSEQLIDEVVQKLADEKLIVTSEMVEKDSASGRVAVVDVAHEALIRQWPLLRQWVDENRDILRQKRKIEAVAEEWRERGKAKDYLLQGKQVTDATAFQKEQAENLTLSVLAQEFIQKSLQHRRNNRFKLVGFGLIIPIALAVFLGIVAERQLRIGRLWQTVNADRGQKYSPGRNLALEELVKLGVSLNKIDLNGANLSGADLSRANLSGANLIGAQLKFANLNHANLNNANLLNADLSMASLISADLVNADLMWSNLSGANLIWSNLSGANLIGADLRCFEILKNHTLCTNFGRAKNLTPNEVKSANNWQQAKYDEDLRKKLGLKK
ncbi:pentapeptide repeat-containing protein [Microcoleus sp. F10-C6]|uniref:nSTAND1 domain-containing NTPase n=1 Tax=unclassified Microcoleus TaxID=2642155 RepID=UPI002FD1ACC9